MTVVSGTPVKTDVEGVEFVGSYEPVVNIPFSDSEAAYYFLSNNVLYQTSESGTPDTMKALRAYFKVPVVGAGARSLTFDVDEETTSIEDVRSKMEDVRGDVFDLQGRRVAQPTKGLYIVNGKKVVVK